MKIVIENSTKIVKFVFNDDDPAELTADKLDCSPKFTAHDMTNQNAQLIENLDIDSLPDDIRPAKMGVK